MPVCIVMFIMEWSVAEPPWLSTTVRMTHRIGRVLVAGGSDCGIIDSFESGTGVDTEAARFLPCNTLVLPPAECVWTIITCGRCPWQPAPEILDRNTVVLFRYLAISFGCVIIASLNKRKAPNETTICRHCYIVCSRRE